jgi:HEAT repeat protein
VTDDPLPELIETLRVGDEVARANAARALGRLGWLAREALPLLVTSLNDDNAPVREAAAQAVGQMGPEAIRHMVQMLTHSDKYVRRNGVWALGKLGPLAKVAVPDLCGALKDPDPRTASGAAQSLGSIGGDAAEAIPALTEAMRGTNVVLCRLAAKALSQIGRAALPTLITHLKHRDPFVRGEAALALGWMGASASAAIPGLIEALKNSRKPIEIPPQPSVDEKTPTTPITFQSSSTACAEDTCRAYAAQALGRIGPAASVAMSALNLAINDPCEQVRQSAQHAIRQLQTAQ